MTDLSAPVAARASSAAVSCSPPPRSSSPTISSKAVDRIGDTIKRGERAVRSRERSMGHREDSEGGLRVSSSFEEIRRPHLDHDAELSRLSPRLSCY